jgi:hypothetical protein
MIAPYDTYTLTVLGKLMGFLELPSPVDDIYHSMYSSENMSGSSASVEKESFVLFLAFCLCIYAHMQRNPARLLLVEGA